MNSPLRLGGRRAAVVGLGVSNLPLIRFLLRSGAEVTGMDRKGPEELVDRYPELRSLGIGLELGPGYLGRLPEFDLIFLAPGIRKDLPELAAARERGAEIASEIGLVLERCRAPVIGVTGSAGKTTTTTLIGEILKADGREVYVGGNIGRPLIEVVDSISPAAVVVLELSSFQLQLVRRSPGIGLITNLSPNHLDVHASLEEYLDAKKNIFRFQPAAGWTVLNRDQPATRALAAECRGRVAFFSRLEELERGAFLRGKLIVFRGPGGERAVCDLAHIRLPGQHNLENVLAAAAVTSCYGAAPKAIARAIAAFEGVEHRLELVRELGGVRYYNDSIASTPERTMAALRTLDGPLHLIAGGYDKHLAFGELAREMLASGKVKTLLLIGATAGKIEAAVREATASEAGDRPPFAGGGAGASPWPEVLRLPDLAAAVHAARSRTRPGEIVVLSPACASFDMYRNFEERGRHFKELVAALGQ